MEKNNGIIPASIEPLSPYDPAYPAQLLSRGLQAQLAKAEKAVESIYRTVVKVAPDAAQLREATKKGFRLVVDATDSTLKDIESGKIKLCVEKGGKTFAQIRNANGNYGSKLPIKKEIFSKGMDPVQTANAMQMRALQDQVQALEDQIVEIDHSVREMLVGQQNDRLGLYYSGVALYIESQSVSDPELKRALTTQALRAVSEASFQLLLTMQSDIRYLADGEYKQAKRKQVELIDSHMQSINKAFAVIHQAALFRAGVYASAGELSAMTAVLSEYSRFIEGTVAQNAELLSQCDVSDTGGEDGVWKSRKNLKLDVSEFIKRIDDSEKTLYLTASEEEVS